MPSVAMLSEERVQDSSDDESSASPEPGLGSKSKSGGTDKTSKKNISALDSIVRGMSSDESDASESSSKSSTSSSSAASKRKAVETIKTTSDPPAKRSKTNLAKVKRVESATYVPPHGYTANRMQSSEITSQAQGILEDLDGKQIWQISAPASFPISKLESLNVPAALNGEPLFQHKGISYGMTRGDSSETALLTAKPNGDYVCMATVNRVFNIRGKSDTTARLENGTIENSGSSQPTQRDGSTAAPSQSNVFFATQTGHKKPPRKQPENLRARCVPYGVVAQVTSTEKEEAQDGDVQMADASPEPVSTQTHSQATPKSSKKSKPKKAHSPEVIVEETPSKRKKEKHAVSSSQGEVPGNDSRQKKRKEKSKKQLETA